MLEIEDNMKVEKVEAPCSAGLSLVLDVDGGACKPSYIIMQDLADDFHQRRFAWGRQTAGNGLIGLAWYIRALCWTRQQYLLDIGL
jgi:hypothetical protein